MGKFLYSLRFQIIPDENVEKNATDLAKFCLKHKIKEVVLFFAGEEWNNGLLSKKEEDIWFETVKKVKEVLQRYNICVSLNPWMTVLHCDRGRRFPKDRKFKPMVSPYGEVSKGCVSFADKNWQKYICDLYGRFAKLNFRIIWIEDDFRYHNHSPLTWGGGFEDEVIEIFSKKIGLKVKRKDIVKNILKPGTVHPWRKLWMQTWRDLQIGVAKKIKESVLKSSKGKTILGLMSSNPVAHSVEGRNWKKLFKVLSIEEKVAHRPHFASYSETIGRGKIFSIAMLDIQKRLRPKNVEVFPEIENFPFTVWSKSDSSTWCEMALALFFGADGLLLDLFPFTGNNVNFEDNKKIGELLDKSYFSLNWISKRFTKDHNLFGVGIPWKENASEFIQTVKGKNLNELYVDPVGAWNILLSYGIPACSEFQRVNVIFGENAWIFNEEEIKEMLKRGILLDGKSAKILCERGFGKYIGVEFKKTLNREESNYSIEVVINEKSGVLKGTYNSVNLMEEFNVFEVENKAIVLTKVITPTRETVGPGVILFENELKGKVGILISDFSKPMNFHRQMILHNIISYLYNEKIPFPLVVDSPYLFPMFFINGRKEVLVLLNGNVDKAKAKIRYLKKIKNSFLLKPLEKPVIKKNLNFEIPYLSFLVLYF